MGPNAGIINPLRPPQALRPQTRSNGDFLRQLIYFNHLQNEVCARRAQGVRKRGAAVVLAGGGIDLRPGLTTHFAKMRLNSSR